MANLPTGTVTLLFTDIEGSTRLWEADATAMRAALARHDALLRHCIEDHDGHVFKTGGDAFCAAFHTAPDALAGALDAQRALHREPWPEIDKAFKWLERAYAQRDPGTIYCASDLLLRPLHSDPRRQPFVQRVGLAQASSESFGVTRS